MEASSCEGRSHSGDITRRRPYLLIHARDVAGRGTLQIRAVDDQAPRRRPRQRGSVGDWHDNQRQAIDASRLEGRRRSAGGGGRARRSGARDQSRQRIGPIHDAQHRKLNWRDAHQPAQSADR
jgi:hypothetical protein